MAEVTLRAMTKRFGAHVVVDELDLHVDEGEFLTLLGPSGCGKTTTLRCIAGLETPTSGELSIGGVVVMSTAGRRRIAVPPEKRRVGMVFQSYALWPHMTVFGNVAYPLRMQRRPRAEVRKRVIEALGLVGLADFATRGATELSGGQQQRVALARAMAAEPRLMLFDEPLSNLDARLRAQMRNLLLRLHQTIGTTSVYVTHDQREAITLSDRIVVMKDGRVVQTGTPAEIYGGPVDSFVAGFVGFDNILDGVVREVGPGGCRVEITGSGRVIELPSARDGAGQGGPGDGGAPHAAADTGDPAFAPPPEVARRVARLVSGQQVRLAVRGSRLRVSGTRPADPCAFEATVSAAVYLGDQFEYTLVCGGAHFVARTALHLADGVGSKAWLSVPGTHVVPLAPVTAQATRA